MKAIGKTVQDILTSLSEERIEPFNNLHDVIMQNLPKDFEAAISYGGLGYVIPHSVYPAGYHCKPIEPLPFAGIASQKNSINFYHMDISFEVSSLYGLTDFYSDNNDVTLQEFYNRSDIGMFGLTYNLEQ